MLAPVVVMALGAGEIQLAHALAPKRAGGGGLRQSQGMSGVLLDWRLN
jgi:hypothetical protein